jgi:predicted nucleic acid-binding protein
LIAYYLDSSAWLKHYRIELGTPVVDGLFTGTFVLGCSKLGPVELTSAIARKRPDGETLTEFKVGLQEDWADFNQVPLDEEILKSASYVAETYGLRGADAIHLASAMHMAFSMMDRSIITIFVSSDLELNAAARHVGFEVLDPQHP